MAKGRLEDLGIKLDIGGTKFDLQGTIVLKPTEGEKKHAGSGHRHAAVARYVVSSEDERDAEIFGRAMRGLRSLEKAVVDVLAHRNNEQRRRIAEAYEARYHGNLIEDLKHKLGGKFEDLVVAMMFQPVEYDAYELRRAMKGLGTDEQCLIEIICTRTNAELAAISAAYQRMFQRNLEDDIKKDTKGHFREILISLAKGARQEHQVLDPNSARQDAEELYKAGEGKIGTDESKFNKILATQSMEQLKFVFDEYENLYNKKIEEAIKSELSGDLKHAYLAIVHCARSLQSYFARRLHRAMKGAGTDDRTLIRIVVSRNEKDMPQIKQKFHKSYGKTLEAAIEEDTSGDYKEVLIAMVKDKQ